MSLRTRSPSRGGVASDGGAAAAVESESESLALLVHPSDPERGALAEAPVARTWPARWRAATGACGRRCSRRWSRLRGRVTAWLRPRLPAFVSDLLAQLEQWPAWRALRLLCAYLLLCAVTLCILLEHTPFGWQGGTLPASESSRSSPAMAAYSDAQWELFDAVLQEDGHIPPHVTGSVAATRLAQWQMQLPDTTALDLPSTAAAPVPASGYPLGPTFQLVTYASESSYPSLLNLIGSAHLWEPTLRVVVYDLGLLQEHVLELQCVDNLLLRPFFGPGSGGGGGAAASGAPQVPDRNTRGVASWRALMAHDALQHASSVLLLAPTFELRQPLRGLKQILQRDGFLLTAAAADSDIGADMDVEVARAGLSFHAALRPQQETSPSDTPLSPSGGPLCAGDILGAVRNSPAYETLVVGAARCALEDRCLAAVSLVRRRRDRASGSKARALGAAADRLEQALLWGDYGRRCNAPERQFRQRDLAQCPLRADRFWPEHSSAEGAVLCLRPSPTSSSSAATDDVAASEVTAVDPAQSYPSLSPYASLVRSNAICVSFMCAPEWVLREGWWVRSGRLRKADPSNWIYRARVTKAAEAQLWWGRRLVQAVLAGVAGRISHARVLVVAGMRMPSAYVLFAAVAAGLQRGSAAGKRLAARHSKPKLFLAWAALWAVVFVVTQSIGANGVE